MTHPHLISISILLFFSAQLWVSVLTQKSSTSLKDHLSSPKLILRAVTPNGTSLYLILNDATFELPFSTKTIIYFNDKARYILHGSRALGKKNPIKSLPWLSSLQEDHRPEEQPHSEANLKQASLFHSGATSRRLQASVVFNETQNILVHCLLDVEQGKRECRSQLAGPFSLITDGSGNRSYALWPQRLLKGRESKAGTVAFLGITVDQDYRIPFLSGPAKVNADGPILVSLTSNSIIFGDPENGHQNAGIQEIQHPLFGFIHGQYIHIWLGSSRKIIIFKDPWSDLKSLPAKSSISLSTVTLSFEQYFDFTGKPETEPNTFKPIFWIAPLLLLITISLAAFILVYQKNKLEIENLKRKKSALPTELKKMFKISSKSSLGRTSASSGSKKNQTQSKLTTNQSKKTSNRSVIKVKGQSRVR